MSHWPWTKSRDVIVQVCSGCPLTMGLHPLYSSMVHRLFVQCRVGHRSELCKVAAEYRFLTVTVHGPRSVRWAQFRNGMSNDNLSFGRPIRPICRHEYSVCRLSRRWTPIKWLNKSRWNETECGGWPCQRHIILHAGPTSQQEGADVWGLVRPIVNYGPDLPSLTVPKRVGRFSSNMAQTFTPTTCKSARGLMTSSAMQFATYRSATPLLAELLYILLGCYPQLNDKFLISVAWGVFSICKVLQSQ